MIAGVLNPAQLLNIQHLIVDEYQDLNPTDLSFVDGLIHSGVIVLVAGDDDQSLYSFRYASPIGIQLFTSNYQNASSHQLSDCFRSTPNILIAAQTLINAFPDPARIPKQLSSLYSYSTPQVPGVFHCWQFQHSATEANCIAESCAKLIAAGIPPREIMVLLSDTRALLPTIKQAFEHMGVSYQSPRGETFLDLRGGRYLFSLLRIACDRNDYVAHRILLGTQPHVGPITCNAIAQIAITHNLNFRDLFYQPLPSNIFIGRCLNAINSARAICNHILDWRPDDLFNTRSADLYSIAERVFGRAIADSWQALICTLPSGIVLSDVRDFLWADNDEQKASILENVYIRLGLEKPVEGFLPPQVRIMTMHGCKGLSANVVFIPGLEDEILPGPHRARFPGLILEAARMVYVSMTRAYAACIVSFSNGRVVYGLYSQRVRSRFVPNLGKPFVLRGTSLSAVDINEIVAACSNL
jgi:DNA helicase-2/ATP-dependent DNA helicase PcrA